MNEHDAALTFLKNHAYGTLATLSPEGAPRARLVYYACDDAMNIYFFTIANTRKAADLAHDVRAAFVVADTVVPQTVQIEGTVEDITETATIDDTIVELVKHLFANAPYYAPLNRFDSGTLKYYRLKPTWLRWGDFTHGIGSDQVFTELPV